MLPLSFHIRMSRATSLAASISVWRFRSRRSRNIQRSDDVPANAPSLRRKKGDPLRIRSGKHFDSGTMDVPGQDFHTRYPSTFRFGRGRSTQVGSSIAADARSVLIRIVNASAAFPTAPTIVLGVSMSVRAASSRWPLGGGTIQTAEVGEVKRSQKRGKDNYRA